MQKLKNFSIVWFNAGNCEIAEVQVQACTFVGAHVPAYNGLTRKQHSAVQKEAVSVQVKELQ